MNFKKLFKAVSAEMKNQKENNDGSFFDNLEIITKGNFPVDDIDFNARAKRRQKASAKLSSFIAAMLVTLIILLVSIFTFASPDKSYSENENRYLAAKPQFSASAVTDGEYMQNAESYLSDQFFARDVFVKTRSAIDIFIGKKEINGVYIGKEHFLFEKPSEYNEKRIAKTTASINSFTSKHPKLSSYIAIAPNSNEILNGLLPDNAPTQNQKVQIDKIYSALEGVQGIDLVSAFETLEDKSSLYYKTDHHWTTYAAQFAFDTIADSMGLDTSKVQYKTYAVTNSFQGTLASSSGIFSSKDSISITVPENEAPYVVSYVEENQKSASIFVPEKLNEKSKYDVFFGGNYAQVNIDTVCENERVLLLIKDSYANCVVPMLTPYFSRIVIIDPRYFTGNIDDTVSSEGVTDVLWLYNANTFLNDTSIYSVF